MTARLSFLSSFEHTWPLAVLILAACLPLSPCQAENPEAIQGRIVVPDLIEQNEVLKLDGEWSFFELNLQNEIISNHTINVPAAWNHIIKSNQAGVGRGRGQYELVIESRSKQHLALKTYEISSAARIFLNDEPILEMGTVGGRSQAYNPEWSTHVVPMQLKAGTNRLRVVVANFSYHKGGIWKPIEIGPPALVQQRHNQTNYINLVLFGALLMMGVYYLLFYTLRPSSFSELSLAIFCIFLSLRTLLIDNRLLQNFFPELPFEILMKLEFYSFYVGIPAFIVFLASLVPRVVWKPVIIAYTTVFILLNIFITIAPANIYGVVNPYVVLTNILIGVYMTIVLFIATLRKNENALFPLIGGIIFLASGINDGLKTRELIDTPTLMPPALFIFTALQAFALSRRSERLRLTTEQLSLERKELGVAMARFVPHEFLKFLGGDLREIRVGQAVDAEMTVMFIDIRGFTRLSESFGSRDTMQFLNAYFRRINPAIMENQGFIDKFIGDGLMALFPGKVDHAMRAAIEIKKKISEYNREREKEGRRTIQFGIGINTGLVTMGTLGDQHRLDTTVVGDTVNLASRVEELNKQLHSNILITSDSRKLLKEEYLLREVGFLAVRGRKEPVSVHECFEYDLDGLIEEKRAVAGQLEEGLAAFKKQDYQLAMQSFQAIARKSPRDPIPPLLVERCQLIMEKQAAGVRKKILVIDDNPAIHNILLHKFKKLQGFQVEVALDGSTALDMQDRTPFDVFIIDVNLGPENGFDLAHEIRSRLDYKARMILLTADDTEATSSHAYQEGLELFHKPAEIDTMIEVLRVAEADDAMLAWNI